MFSLLLRHAEKKKRKLSCDVFVCFCEGVKSCVRSLFGTGQSCMLVSYALCCMPFSICEEEEKKAWRRWRCEEVHVWHVESQQFCVLVRKVVPQMKTLPWYSLKAEKKGEEEDDMIYETIWLLTPKTLSAAEHVPLLPLHYMLRAPWRPRDRWTREEKDKGRW